MGGIMLDFEAVRKQTKTYQDLAQGISKNDLRNLTTEMIDVQLEIVSTAQDADVVYVPEDPDANDPFAKTEDEIHMPWTLGHVVVHVTASSEEAAFFSAELARGVPYRPRRSRYEVHWKSISTVKQCKIRLEESRRMRLACLEIWPDIPHLENTYKSRSGIMVNPIIQFLFGLSHDDAHLEQMRTILQQAKIDRP
jgi:hypothetical protein